MEDYHAAFSRCAVDVEALHKQKRRVAAMHFGGVAIECLLKHMIFFSLQEDAVRDWHDGTDETRDYGHTYKNLGHDYDAALGCLNIVRDRLKQYYPARYWLNTVERPDGHFIDMRYAANEPEEERYAEWYRSYLSIKGWLEVKGMELLNENKEKEKNKKRRR